MTLALAVPPDAGPPETAATAAHRGALFTMALRAFAFIKYGRRLHVDDHR